ncbi:MAG: DUF2851 family protein [Verrucomicrobiota bacterium]|nr:DUF2851 family protein [Verrucomicrobiota bacterium]
MPAADRYAELRQNRRLHERALFPPEREPTELELQARWFAGDFGRRFRSTADDEIEVVQFGIWNREAGPDFSDAAVRINGGAPVGGSIEFDLTDRNWETHGHAVNPAFNDTVLHVFLRTGAARFFTRTLINRNVPQIQVNPAALQDLFTASVPLAHAGRCHAPLKDLPGTRIESILGAAAQFRLQRKAVRLQRLVEDHGRDQALFGEIATALGYKQNKLPFTLLAQRLPLRMLREDAETAEARLFGLAGFLHESDLGAYPTPTRTYVRTLWDRWWPHRDAFERLILAPKLWRLSGGRPLNHPQRRLAALGLIAREWPALIHSLGQRELTAPAAFFDSLHHPFWDFHYTLDSTPAAREMALVGGTRFAELAANVLLPYFASQGAEVWDTYRQLRARLTNRRVETAATRLFAEDSRRAAFAKTIAHQQGLLQIYEDFCLQDNSDCAQCPFPEQMQKWQ